MAAIKKIDFLRPASFSNRYKGESPEIHEGWKGNVMNILSRLIRAAIESFPVDQERKDAILKKLPDIRNRGAENHVL